MPNNAYTQRALANDPGFLVRLAGAMLRKAPEVLTEDNATLNHAARIAYASKVMAHADVEAAKAAPFMVMRTNVFNFDTTCQFDQDRVIVVNASGDADLEAQVLTDWNSLAAMP